MSVIVAWSLADPPLVSGAGTGCGTASPSLGFRSTSAAMRPGHSRDHGLTVVGAAALIATTLALPARAGGDEEALEVVVRGTSAGAWTSQTSADTAAREPVDAAALLAELPSVHVRRLGGDGSFGTLSVRGSASTQVGVVLAGIPLTSAADPSIDAGGLPLWPGATFRVYRGFAPARLGATGYLGGVVAIDPAAPAATPRTEWWALAGSFGALKLRLGDARRIGDLSIASGLYGSRSDGDFTYEETDDFTGAVTERTRGNAGHAAAGLVERVSLDRPWGSIGATLFAETSRHGVPGPADLDARDGRRFASLSAGRLAAGIDARFRSGPSAVWHAALWGRRDTSTFDDPLGEIDPTRPGAHVVQAIEGAGASFGWRGRPVDALTADLLLDGRVERFVPEESAVAATGTGATRLAGGLGLDLTWRATDGVELAATGRLDARRDDAEGAFGLGQVALGSSSDLAPSGHLGGALRITDGIALAAHAGALERPPSFVELYGDRGTLIGDPRLLPERALSFDLGVQGDAGDRAVRFGYELVGFVTTATNLIAFVPRGRSTAEARNVAEALVVGGELTTTLTTRRLSTRIGYTLLHTEDRSDDALTRGRSLPGRPLHDLTADVSYGLGPVRVRYGLDVLAGITVDPEGAQVLPPRALHSAGASLDVPGLRGLRAGFEVDNLLDVRTQHFPSELRERPAAVPLSDFLGYPLPGRSVLGTLRYVAR